MESKGLRSSSKDGEYALSPTAGREVKKEQGSRDPKKPKENKKECSSLVKKKCLNGFIMFCRMNRKHYIRWVGILFDADLDPSFIVHVYNRSSVPSNTHLLHLRPSLILLDRL